MTAAHVGAFVLGLFIGTNLGVLLMCLFQINRPRAPVEVAPWEGQ